MVVPLESLIWAVVNAKRLSALAEAMNRKDTIESIGFYVAVLVCFPCQSVALLTSHHSINDDKSCSAGFNSNHLKKKRNEICHSTDKKNYLLCVWHYVIK